MSRMASANAMAPLRPVGTEEEDLVLRPNDNVSSDPLLPLGANKLDPRVLRESHCLIQKGETYGNTVFSCWKFSFAKYPKRNEKNTALPCMARSRTIAIVLQLVTRSKKKCK